MKEERIDERTEAGKDPQEMDLLECDPWEALADAVIAQAAVDYRMVCLRLRRGTTCRRAEEERRELEEFFLSRWFACLSGVPGEQFLGRLREEMSPCRICRVKCRPVCPWRLNFQSRERRRKK